MRAAAIASTPPMAPAAWPRRSPTPCSTEIPREVTAAASISDIKLQGVTGKTLAQLVAGGFVHVGGVQLGGVAVDQTVSESLAQAGVSLATGATVPLALARLWCLQRACEIQVAQAALGPAIPVSEAVARKTTGDALQWDARFGAGQDVFDALVRRARADDALALTERIGRAVEHGDALGYDLVIQHALLGEHRYG